MNMKKIHLHWQKSHAPTVWKTYIIGRNRKKEIHSSSLWRHEHLGEQV